MIIWSTFESNYCFYCFSALFLRNQDSLHTKFEGSGREDDWREGMGMTNFPILNFYIG